MMTIDELSQDLRHLTDTIGRGLAEVHRRFDDDRKVGDDRHRDNLSRFDRQDDRLAVIETDIRAVQVECAKTNGTLGRHQSWLNRHDSQIKKLFTRVKDAATAVVVGREEDLERRRLTLRDARIYITLVGFGGTAAWFVLTVLLKWGPK